MPHLSLLYGDFSNDVKEEIKAKARREFPDVIAEFDAACIALYRTDPQDLEMKTWEKIAEFPLL